MNASWVALLGRDYGELGPLAGAALPQRGAVALSRGAYPKPYAHTDPNEDGALVACSRDSGLLCVVDGHSGAHCSELALSAVCARADALLAAHPGDFVPFARAIVEELVQSLGPREPSRTCLVVALVRADHCLWASFGDSALVRAASAAPVSPSDNGIVLGPGLRLDTLSPAVWSGSFEPKPGERIAAVTDGVLNFAREPDIQHTLREVEDDGHAALGLARQAMLGGAGDNVAVATIRA